MHTLDPPVDLDNADLKPALDYMLDEASKQEFTYTSVSVSVIASLSHHTNQYYIRLVMAPSTLNCYITDIVP